MTNIYAHLADGDAPKSQHVTEVSFVDESGKHIDIGAGAGGGIVQVAHDNSITGDGTSTSPLKVRLNHATAMLDSGKTVYPTLMKTASGTVNGIGFNVGDGLKSYNTADDDIGSGVKLDDSISAQLEDTETTLTNLRNLAKLQNDAKLADVITTVNAILDAIKSNA